MVYRLVYRTEHNVSQRVFVFFFRWKGGQTVWWTQWWEQVSVSGQMTTFCSWGCKQIKFQKRRSVGNSLPDDGKPTKNQAIPIINIFILLSLHRRRMEAYKTTTLLVHTSDLCIYVSYLNFRIFSLNFTNFGMGVMSSRITYCFFFYYFSSFNNNNNMVGVQMCGTGTTLATLNLVH
jgi:hypothetical protein